MYKNNPLMPVNAADPEDEIVPANRYFPVGSGNSELSEMSLFVEMQFNSFYKLHMINA